MSVIFAEPSAPDQSTYVYWRCENCMQTSEPNVWEGRWAAAKEANKDLQKHIIEEHDGFIFADAKTNIKEKKHARRPKLRRSR